MQHVQAVEPRHLFAATLDTTFGNGGHAGLSFNYLPFGVLATHGAVYVDALDRPRNRRVIFKYDDQGVRDNSWGRGGYVLPSVYYDATEKTGYVPGYQRFDRKLTLALDARTQGLIVGFGAGDTVNVERYTKSGATDADWGNDGRYKYSAVKTQLTLERMTPLSGKKLLLTFDRQQLLGPVIDGVRQQDGVSDVALLRLGRFGKTDKAFNNGRALAVADGSYHENATSRAKFGAIRTGTVDSDEPKFWDLQSRDDGGVRVISTRVDAHSVLTLQQQNASNSSTVFQSKAVVTAESTVVSATGERRPEQSQSYVLRRDASTLDSNASYSNYIPAAAFATGDDGLVVLANSGRDTAIVRLAPGYRSKPTYVLPTQSDDEKPATLIGSATRSLDGTVLVTSTNDASNRLNADFTFDEVLAYGHFSAVGLDDEGRLVAADYGNDRIDRYR